MVERSAKSSKLLIYEDKPYYDPIMRLVFIIVPALPLFGAFYSLWQEELPDMVGAFATSFFIVVLFWAIFPRRYLIFEDSVRIILGGPFSFNILFDTIKSAQVSSRIFFGISWTTAITKYHVEITRQGRISVAITPNNYDFFVENLNKALSDWRGR